MKSKFSFIFILAAALGLTLGIGSFTFIYGKGYAYLQDDPKACTNCHIMRDQYESWLRSSHHNVATCNSCHTPENIYMKYFNKAENGFTHAMKFTLHKFNDPIRIRKHNFDIAMNSCFKCHSDLLKAGHHEESLREGKACVQCHRQVGHSH